MLTRSSPWIERTYNRRRRQHALGKLAPVEYELAFARAATAVLLQQRVEGLHSGVVARGRDAVPSNRVAPRTQRRPGRGQSAKLRSPVAVNDHGS